MTSRDRMLAAIAREKPDRLPVTVHQWQPYHLRAHMKMDELEAFSHCGLDAAVNYYEAETPDSPEWRVMVKTRPGDGTAVAEYTIDTPGGRLHCAEGSSPMTTWVTEPLIKDKDDIELLKYRPLPRLNKAGAAAMHDAVGERGILRTFLCGKQGGCWQDACELYGTERLIMETFDDPDWVHAFLAILLEEKLRYIEESLRGAPFDLVETGGGASSNTVISPAIHREFCLPYDKRQHDALHREGFKAVYHTCGGMSKITGLIVANGCDVSETLSPAAIGGDIGDDATARQVYGDLFPKVALIGGMNQFGVLSEGTPGQIAAEVRRLFELFGGQGGYILSACDHFFDVPPENLVLYGRAARDCVY